MNARAPQKIYSWDIETTSWDQILCACVVSSTGERWTFWGGDALERIADLMEELGGTWVAHAGGIFDVPLLMNVDRPKLSKLIVTGSSILCAEGPKRLKLRDTYPATLASLSKLGDWVGLAKLDVDRGHLEDITQQETLDYCVRDCEVLLKATEAFLAYQESQGARKAWTAGAAAVSLLRALEPGTWALLRRHALDEHCAIGAAAAVQGGRVEAWAKGKIPRVWSYDFKSSYPARYAEQKLGVGCRPAVPGDTCAIWLARWQWPDRRMIPPVLDAWCKAGAGWCEGWIVPEERAALIECGVAVTLIEGWAAITEAEVGQNFVRELYAQKAQGVPWAKVYVNSLHGKFSETILKDQWTREHPSEYWAEIPPTKHGRWWHSVTKAIDKDGRAAPHVQPIAAAQILGRARVALWRVAHKLQNAGWEVYYCDTDSMHSNCPPDQMAAAGIALGGQLGDLELESGPEACEGIYLGPKAYLLIRDGEIVKSALKGVPLRAYEHGQVTRDYLSGDYVYAEAANRGHGEDLRIQLFENALHPDRNVFAVKEGITSFTRGVKMRGDVYAKETLRRNIRPTSRGKKFGPGPADYYYLTPREAGKPEPVEEIKTDQAPDEPLTLGW